MPWFPDFISAVEQARMETRSAARADPVAQYVRALNEGTTHDLETAWPGEVIVHDPRAGTIRGHRRLRTFVEDNKSWLAGHHARIETGASTRVKGRAVVELLAHLSGDGPDVAWPVAVVAESTDAVSVVFRTYCSQQPVDGRRHVRPPILKAGQERPSDVVGRYHAALDDGDVNAVVDTFAPDGYYREPIGPHRTHRGADELRSFFTRRFSAGGGIGLTPCVVTDDRVRSAVEYNCTRWGRQDLPAQAGLAIYERRPDGLLAAVRVYDDIELPDGRR
jgi:limonene-1,2-epoxide hydrolase